MATSTLPDPYASHLPFLRRHGKGVTCVLELGMGQYSTPMFLDREVYPDLLELISLEHDLAWANRLKAQIRDPRWLPIVRPEPFEKFLACLALAHFTLIFVDHSTDWQRRAATIRWLAEQELGKAKVIIHDFEEPCYQEAAEGFRFKIVDTTVIPHTAMVWK